jgi:hypothetical protein
MCFGIVEQNGFSLSYSVLYSVFIFFFRLSEWSSMSQIYPNTHHIWPIPPKFFQTLVCNMLGTFDNSETTQFLSVLVMLLNLSRYLHCVEVSWPNTGTAKMIEADDMGDELPCKGEMRHASWGESMWTIHLVQDSGPWTGRISWPAEWLS